MSYTILTKEPYTLPNNPTSKQRRRMKKAKPPKSLISDELPFLPGIANTFGRDLQEKIAASIPARVLYFGKVAMVKPLASPSPEELCRASEEQEEF